MIKKNAKPDSIAEMLNNLDAADSLICEALRRNGLTKSGDAFGRHALHSLRRFIEMLEEEANEKFSGQDWPGAGYQ
jgi:hypothetical protein